MTRPLIRKIDLQNSNYHQFLREIHRPPDPLYFLGIPPTKDELIIGIVGTRKAGRAGRNIAETIARDLVGCGVTVASGLALGIDAAAHNGALSGGGRTVAVLGSGLDNIYPHQHHNLAKEIVKSGGALLSEYAPDEPSYPSNFLERNRVIAGLSVAIVIIEAPIKSGALSTARHAINEGREVFVVPGPADSANYEGSHQLLRDGARLVTKTSEILSDLNIDYKTKANAYEPKNVLENNILNLLKSSVMSVDEIMDAVDNRSSEINKILGRFVLDGVVTEVGGKYRITNGKKYSNS